MKTPIIQIGNRTMCHYLLSVFSLLLRGYEEIVLTSRGSLNGKNSDFAYLISEDIMPYTFTLEFENTQQEIPSINSLFKSSILTSTLKLQKAKIPDLNEWDQTIDSSNNDNIIEMDICELELLINLLYKRGIKSLTVSTIVEDNRVELGQLDIDNHEIIIGDMFHRPIRITDKPTKILSETKSKLTNSLIRSGVLKPDLEKYRGIISQWDDVIFGLDTNLFYTGILTASLLDMLLKIPSGNFIDSPDWITLVLSKVAMGEIENRAIRSHDDSSRREALRAIQEIMLINRSKDLEGVSMFLTGTIPPEISFTTGETASIRDSIIREHFRSFLKHLDFYKGSYFLTQDFNNATLAEAEGLVTLYIKKPSIDSVKYTLYSTDIISPAEVIYELGVEFLPIIIEGNGMELKIYSDWQGKNLEDWEDWRVRVECCSDPVNIQPQFEYWQQHEKLSMMLRGWQNLRERYVSWVK